MTEEETKEIKKKLKSKSFDTRYGIIRAKKIEYQKLALDILKDDDIVFDILLKDLEKSLIDTALAKKIGESFGIFSLLQNESISKEQTEQILKLVTLESIYAYGGYQTNRIICTLPKYDLLLVKKLLSINYTDWITSTRIRSYFSKKMLLTLMTNKFNSGDKKLAENLLDDSGFSYKFSFEEDIDIEEFESFVYFLAITKKFRIDASKKVDGFIPNLNLK